MQFRKPAQPPIDAIEALLVSDSDSAEFVAAAKRIIAFRVSDMADNPGVVGDLQGMVQHYGQEVGLVQMLMAFFSAVGLDIPEGKLRVISVELVASIRAFATVNMKLNGSQRN